MFSKINSIYLLGMEGKNVTVEADVSDGLPGLILVGYLASEVREGGDRVRTAIKNLGLSLPGWTGLCGGSRALWRSRHRHGRVDSDGYFFRLRT